MVLRDSGYGHVMGGLHFQPIRSRRLRVFRLDGGIDPEKVSRRVCWASSCDLTMPVSDLTKPRNISLHIIPYHLISHSISMLFHVGSRHPNDLFYGCSSGIFALRRDHAAGEFLQIRIDHLMIAFPILLMTFPPPRHGLNNLFRLGGFH